MEPHTRWFLREMMRRTRYTTLFWLLQPFAKGESVITSFCSKLYLYNQFLNELGVFEISLYSRKSLIYLNDWLYVTTIRFIKQRLDELDVIQIGLQSRKSLIYSDFGCLTVRLLCTTMSSFCVGE